jgi:hypothetical protein
MEEKQVIRTSYLWMAISVVVVLMLSSCANREAWKQTIIKDHLKGIETTILVYEQETAFTMGTKGGDKLIIFNNEGE